MLQAQALALLIPKGLDRNMAGATRFLARRRLAAGSVSSLRKAARAQRIAAGQRPLSMPRRREDVIAEVDGFELVLTATLLPTKGWRDVRRRWRKAD